MYNEICRATLDDNIDIRITYVEKLQHRRALLEEQLVAINKAITSLENNPELTNVLDSLAAVGF